MTQHPQPPLRSASEIVRAESIDSGLHARTFGLVGLFDAKCWRLVHLVRGEAEFRIGGESFPSTGPCLVWQPWAPEDRLTIAAGTVGAQALIGSAIVAGAIGRAPEAPELRLVADRRAQVLLGGQPDLARTVAEQVSAIRYECAAERPGSRTVIEGLLRILLIRIWRDQGAPRPLPEAGATSLRLLNRFAGLVDANFRSRWTVARYAAELGISADRLTDICRRVRGRTPRAIVSERICAEACYLLDHSLHSAEQIAGLLGFPSAAQFSRFFRAETGVPPGTYRRRHRATDQPAPPRVALSEWP